MTSSTSNSEMQQRRQALWIVLIALVALVAWTLAHRWLPKAEIAETNFQANLIRLQAWMFEASPSNVIVGSSISGRLLPKIFADTPLASMANLGLDGSGPEFGLRLMLARSNPPPQIFVEVHRLGKPWNANDDMLLIALLEPEFAIAGSISGLRANTRPTTLVYNWFKGRHEPVQKPTALASLFTSIASANATNRVWRPHFAEQVAELHRRGSEVILLRLPVGRENPANPDTPDTADELAAKLGLRMIDLNREAVRRGLEISYTDGLHLSTSSALAVSHLLAELVSATL